MPVKTKSKPRQRSFKAGRVAIVSTYLPRKCGIATFTNSIYRNMRELDSSMKISILAIDKDSHDYPEEVEYVIKEDCLESYIAAAEWLNSSLIDLVSVQFEFGIFGKKNGSLAIPLLENIKKPVVVTMHSLPPNPNREIKKTVQEISRNSAILVVMAKKAAEVLNKKYLVSRSKIRVIPHGVPAVSSIGESATKKAKEKLSLGGRKVISTFGLLRPQKGIEYVLEAMVFLKERYPDILYLIIGATHPYYLNLIGEKYRYLLKMKVLENQLEDNVIFVDKFISEEELIDYLLATDIYINPYTNPSQISSGPLSYALGLGRAVISTPYFYARQLLCGKRGIIVPYKRPAFIAKAVDKVFKDAKLKGSLEKSARKLGRTMRWPKIVASYRRLFVNIDSGSV